MYQLVSPSRRYKDTEIPNAKPDCSAFEHLTMTHKFQIEKERKNRITAGWIE